MKRVMVLGVAGGTASGKTTLAMALAGRLGDRASLLMHDRYYKTLDHDCPPDAPERNFDHPDSLDTARMVADVDALRAGQATRVPTYDFSRHARCDEAEWEWMQPRPVLIVEGILVLADEALRQRMDYKVYVHAPDDIRLSRRIRRDVAERGRTVESVLTQYEATVRPMHERFVLPSRTRADLVLSGLAPTEAMVAEVFALTGLS